MSCIFITKHTKIANGNSVNPALSQLLGNYNLYILIKVKAKGGHCLDSFLVLRALLKSAHEYHRQFPDDAHNNMPKPHERPLMAHRIPMQFHPVSYDESAVQSPHP